MGYIYLVYFFPKNESNGADASPSFVASNQVMKTLPLPVRDTWIKDVRNFSSVTHKGNSF